MTSQNDPKNLSDDVQKAIYNFKEVFEQNEDYVKFERIYQEMKKLGLIKKQEYNIPLIDTIGRKYYQELKNSNLSH